MSSMPVRANNSGNSRKNGGNCRNEVFKCFQVYIERSDYFFARDYLFTHEITFFFASKWTIREKLQRWAFNLLLYLLYIAHISST